MIDKDNSSGNTTNEKKINSINTEPETQQEPQVSVDASRRLTCFFKTETKNGEIISVPKVEKEDGDNDTTILDKVFLLQENGKKSSFLLEPENSKNDDTTSWPSSSLFYSVPKPSNVVIEHESPHSREFPYFLGGFQLVSTAKAVEVYPTDIEGNESYLMTSKGIPFNKEDKTAEWYKAICVVPGGPRPISSLRIKLLSLRPVDATFAKLQSMKLTARIPEPPSPMMSTQSSSSLMMISTATDNPERTSTATPTAAFDGPMSPMTIGSISDAPTLKNHGSYYSSIFGAGMGSSSAGSQSQIHTVSAGGGAVGGAVTQSDLNAAMAGVSFVARSTEKNIEETLKEQTMRLENHMASCFLRMEQQICTLKSTLVVQQQLLQDNQTIIRAQQQLIERQDDQMGKLLKSQEDLRVRVQSLQADMSILRYQRLEDNSNKNNKGNDDVDTQERDIVPADEEDNSGIFEEEGSGGVPRIIVTDDEQRIKERQVRLLKDLIRKTAREMEEKPAVGCGPMIDHKPLGCGPMVLSDDDYLFKEMMLSAEELRFKEMNALMATLQGKIKVEKTPKVLYDNSKDDDNDQGDDSGDEGDDDDGGCQNIEVTLVEDECQEESPGKERSVDVDTGGDEDTTVAAGNTMKGGTPRGCLYDDGYFQEKKEIDPADSVDAYNFKKSNQEQQEQQIVTTSSGMASSFPYLAESAASALSFS